MGSPPVFTAGQPSIGRSDVASATFGSEEMLFEALPGLPAVVDVVEAEESDVAEAEEDSESEINENKGTAI